MYKIELKDRRKVEVTEEQFKALVRAVFTGSHPAKTNQIHAFHYQRQTRLTGWETFQAAKRKHREKYGEPLTQP